MTIYPQQERMVRPEIEKRIDDWIEKMTLQEKAGQLTQLRATLLGGVNFAALLEDPDPDVFKDMPVDYQEDAIREGSVGSFLGVYGAEVVNRLQRIAVEESRLGIPLIFGMDVIHGLRTIFPIPLAEACSWEPELARKSAEIAAREAASTGLHWTFAPMMDIARDARWGRVSEGAGEDPFLGSAIAAARVKGFQGEDLADVDHVVACAKHYIAYGGATAGRDYNTVDVSLQTLNEVYLPPFEAAVQAGVGTVMSAFNDINGVPASANRYTLTDLLRGKMGFRGLVVSDYNSIGELVAHRFAVDRKDAGCKALNAGLDMDMGTESYRWDIPALVEEGRLTVKVVDEAVRRVLRVKFALGLFDCPYRSDGGKEARTLLRADHVEAARDAARRCMVLLKNEGQTLPLSKSLKKIAVVGPLADQPFEMLGSWAFTGSKKDVSPILAGIRAAVEEGSEVLYAKGCEVLGTDTSGFAAAVAEAGQADAVIAVVGEKATMSGEASSRMELGLPVQQEALLKALRATGRPLVVLLVTGRPLAIPWAAEHAAAILVAWEGGIQAGPAAADVLFGDYNPAGKLAATFPYAVGQCPIYYNHPSTGRPAGEFKFTSKYIDGPSEPLYPFGFGLSYTSFEYTGLVVTPAEIPAHGKVMVSAWVTNTGERAGEEVVQLYTSDCVASRVRPVKELKGFQKVLLQPGESREIRFELEAAALGFYNSEMTYGVEPGEFQVWVGPNSKEGLEGRFQVQ
jgi:beta-glucosidase